MKDGIEYTALTYACWNFDLRTVDLLLEHGARVDIDNPLHKCVEQILRETHSVDMYMRGFVMVMHLIDHGAMIDITTENGSDAIAYCLMNTPLATDNPIIISASLSTIRLIFLENAIKIPDKNYLEVELVGYSLSEVLSFEHLEMCPYLYTE